MEKKMEENVKYQRGIRELKDAKSIFGWDT